MGNDVSPIRHFSDLRAWQESKTLTISVYRATKSFPLAEQFGLTSQIRRAVTSIPANIAEGFSRRTSKDKRSFYHVALASLAELESHLIISNELTFLDRDDLHRLQQQMVSVGKLLTGLQRSATDRA